MQVNLAGRSVLVLGGSAHAAVAVSALLRERAVVTVAGRAAVEQADATALFSSDT